MSTLFQKKKQNTIILSTIRISIVSNPIKSSIDATSQDEGSTAIKPPHPALNQRCNRFLIRGISRENSKRKGRISLLSSLVNHAARCIFSTRPSQGSPLIACTAICQRPIIEINEAIIPLLLRFVKKRFPKSTFYLGFVPEDYIIPTERGMKL